MSSDEIHFLLVLYLIYLSDCFQMPRASALVLYSRFQGLRLRVKNAESGAVFARRFWLLRPLLPPFGASFRLEIPRCAPGLKGFCSLSPVCLPAANEEPRYIAYDAVESIEVDEHTFKVNGEPWFKGGAFMLAGLKADLDSIRSAADRGAAVQDSIESGFARGRNAVGRLEEIQKKTGWLNLFCSVYTVWLLGVLPLALFRFSMQGLLWGAGVPLLAFHLLCGVLFIRAHRKLVENRGGLLWESFAKMFLCPPMMLRACDVVADHAGVPGDAVSVMMHSTAESIWKPHVRNVWHALMPCRRTTLVPEVAEAMDEYGRAYRKVLSVALKEQGVAPETLELNPAEVGQGNRFCPRCETVYRSDQTACHDCGGLPLLTGTKG